VTATESDVRAPDVDGGEGTVHCAVHSSGETPDEEAHARPRVRTREGSDESAQSQPDSAPPVDLTKPPATVTWSDRIAEAAGKISPPDIWSHDRPALRRVWAYAARGDWTGPDGAPRRAGQIYALAVAMPVVAVAYMVAWAAERCSRMVALIVLLILLSQVPPLAWLV